MKVLPEPAKFQWDEGNSEKNFKKHKITIKETEEVFFDINKKLFKDIIHSENEDRFIILGKTKEKKLLYVVFTVRNKKVRVISSRTLNKKEVYLYEEKA